MPETKTAPPPLGTTVKAVRAAAVGLDDNSGVKGRDKVPKNLLNASSSPFCTTLMSRGTIAIGPGETVPMPEGAEVQMMSYIRSGLLLDADSPEAKTWVKEQLSSRK